MAKYRVVARLRKQTEERLRRIARIGEVFVDGDAFKSVVLTPELNTGDTYCVDHDKFISVKQTLLKLKRIEDGDVGVVAWRRFKNEADITIPADLHPLSVRPGNHPISPAMAEAFAGRVAVQELNMRGFPLLSVCAPIRDSLDDVVGILEVFASLVPHVFRVNKMAD
jgi:hypothetical protein